MRYCRSAYKRGGQTVQQVRGQASASRSLTLGVLYLLQNGENITSLSDLKGKTVYVPGAGANTEDITAALLESAGLEVGKDVTVDGTTYNSPDALQAAITANKSSLAVLPEPKVTATILNNKDVKVALDLTSEWE